MQGAVYKRIASACVHDGIHRTYLYHSNGPSTCHSPKKQPCQGRVLFLPDRRWHWHRRHRLRRSHRNTGVCRSGGSSACVKPRGRGMLLACLLPQTENEIHITINPRGWFLGAVGQGMTPPGFRSLSLNRGQAALTRLPSSGCT